MAQKNLIGKLADNAIKSLQDPKGTAGKVVVQVKGTAAMGMSAAEHVGRSAVSKAAGTTRDVLGKVSGGRASPSRAAEAPSSEAAQSVQAPLRSVPDVDESDHKPAEREVPVADEAPAPASNSQASEVKAAASPADVAEVVEAAVASDPAKTAARKVPAKKATPGAKLPTKKAAPEKSD